MKKSKNLEKDPKNGLLIKEKPKTKPEPKPKPEPEPEPKPEPKPKPEPEPEPEPDPEPTPEPEPEPKPEPEPEPEPKPKPTPEPEPEPKDKKKGLYINREKGGNTPDSIEDLRNQIKDLDVETVQSKVPKKPIVERKKTQRRGRKKNQPDSFQVEGYVILMVIDTLIPSILVAGNNMFNKKFKLKTTDLQFSPEQWKQVEPIADQAAEFLTININPVAGLFIVSGIFYGSNYLVQLNENL